MTLKTAFPFLILAFALKACLPEPEPVSETLNTFQYYYNYLLESYDLQWEINNKLIGTGHTYGEPAEAIVSLDMAEQLVSFQARDSDSGLLIDTLSRNLVVNGAYMVAILGTEEEPHLLCEQMNTRYPSLGMVKYRFLHAAPELGPVDIYIGGDQPDYKVLSGVDFADVTEYYENTEYDLWESILITPLNTLPADSTILSYTANATFRSGWIYLCTINHVSPTTESSLEMQVYEQPIY